VEDETNANWSSGLTLWGWLHGTLRLNIPQDWITIGVPAYRAPEEVELGEILKLPFVEQRPSNMGFAERWTARRRLIASRGQSTSPVIKGIRKNSKC